VMIGRRQLIINLFSGHMKSESGLFRVSASFFMGPTFLAEDMPCRLES